MFGALILFLLFFVGLPVMAVTCTEETIGHSCTTEGKPGTCRAVGLEVYRCVSTPVSTPTDPPPTLEGNISPIIEKMLDYLFPLAGLIAVIFIIQGGYMWIISAGDPSKVKQAQGTLTWAVIGLVFILIIFSVLQVVLKFMY